MNNFDELVCYKREKGIRSHYVCEWTAMESNRVLRAQITFHRTTSYVWLSIILCTCYRQNYGDNSTKATYEEKKKTY